MGLAAMGGGLLAVHPLAFLLTLGTLIFFVLVLHHGARGSVVTGLVVPLVLWAVGLRGTEFWVAVAAGLVVAVRFTIDWNRKYRELWLDRGQ